MKYYKADLNNLQVKHYAMFPLYLIQASATSLNTI